MGSPRHGYFSPWRIPTLPDAELPKGTYLPDHLTDEAIRLICANRDSGKPFFLNFWYYLVHTPIQAPESLVEKYRLKARALGLDKRNPFEEGERFPSEHGKDQRVMRRRFQSDPTYAAMVQSMDDNIGRLLTCSKPKASSTTRSSSSRATTAVWPRLKAARRGGDCATAESRLRPLAPPGQPHRPDAGYALGSVYFTGKGTDSPEDVFDFSCIFPATRT
jgi:hypothetical protein